MHSAKIFFCLPTIRFFRAIGTFSYELLDFPLVAEMRKAKTQNRNFEKNALLAIVFFFRESIKSEFELKASERSLIRFFALLDVFRLTNFKIDTIWELLFRL